MDEDMLSVSSLSQDQQALADHRIGYDDVNPSGGVDQSGTLADGNPQLLSVYVGGA